MATRGMPKMLAGAASTPWTRPNGTLPSRTVIKAIVAPIAVASDTRCGALRHMALIEKKKPARAAGVASALIAAARTTRPARERRRERSGTPSGRRRLFHRYAPVARTTATPSETSARADSGATGGTIAAYRAAARCSRATTTGGYMDDAERPASTRPASRSFSATNQSTGLTRAIPVREASQPGALDIAL